MTFPILLALAASSAPERVGLEGTWRLTQADRKIAVPARVPGVVQTDLMRAGLIPDPYFGTNERKVQWVGDLSWTYARGFTVAPAFLRRRRIVLRCEGLDTIATVRINGREVARTDNMFRTWEFDAKPFLKAGANTIQVELQPLEVGMKAGRERARLFGKPVQADGKHFVRKPPFQGGWDFAPKLFTMGIWRKIGLVGWDAARLTDLETVQDHRVKGQVGLEVKVAADVVGATKAYVVASFGGRPVAQASAPLKGGRGAARLTILRPNLWWPNEMGPQNLYEVRVELRDASGRVVDQGTRRIGLRTLTWSPKTAGAPLTLAVNGRRFFAKGSNWVPEDSLLREDPARERSLVRKAVGAHMNLLRLWGGGYYEDDALFDACDERGLLVWFEFKYADAPYPSFDPRWLTNARAEAQDNVRRVRHHPCLAVYSGNNEVIGFIRDATTESAMNRAEYDRLFHTMLREVVHDLAPDAFYTPGSPEIGDDHYWDVWHGGATFASYRDRHGFMSEYGFQAFPVPRSVEAFTAPADRASVETPAMLQHQKNWRDGNALIVSTALRDYRKAKDFDSTLWLGQISQAAGIVTGVEHWRRDWPASSASLVWQFNDPWPVTSWSMIDWYGRPKALYYALKRAYAPVALSGLADPKTGAVELWVATDRPAAKSARVDWTLTRLDGTRVEGGSAPVAIPAGAGKVRVLAKNLKATLQKEGATNLLFWATLRTPGEPDSSTLLTFARAKEIDLLDPGLKATVVPRGTGYRVTVTSARPALWTWIELKGMDAELSDNFVHVQAGAPAMIDVVPSGRKSLAQVRAALNVRSLYDTYRPGTRAYATIQPDTDGRIVATADDADIQGAEPVLEIGAPANLGNWRSVDSPVRWTVRGAKAGKYAVTALVSAPESDAGGTFEVELGGSRVTGKVPATKSWTDYVELTLGTLNIAKDGAAMIVLRPTSKPHDNLMNLRSLRLTPEKP